MASYFLAPSLEALRAEINEQYPRRSKASDGWIGDASHSARPSDHNPDWRVGGKRRGIVRAIDITNDGIDVGELLDDLIGDPRVYYVISRGYIYSRTYGFAKRRYTGSNRHDHHVHVSIRSTPEAERDGSPWLGGKPAASPAKSVLSGRKVYNVPKVQRFGTVKRGKKAQFRDEPWGDVEVTKTSGTWEFDKKVRVRLVLWLRTKNAPHRWVPARNFNLSPRKG